MGRIWSQAIRLAVLANMLLLVQCGGEIQAPETGATPQARRDATPLAEPTAQVTWVSCLPPQSEALATPALLCPSPAPGQFMLTIADRELTPKIQEYIVARHGDAEVTDVVLTFQPDAFVIRGTLLRPLRTTIQVSGRLIVRNGRIEAENVKGKLGIFPVPAGYMAEAAAEVNEILDPWFRTEYGIRVTNVEIAPGELRLTGESLSKQE